MKKGARKPRTGVLAVLVTLAALGIISPPAASAGPTGETGNGEHASPWPEETKVVTVGDSPSLSSEPGPPRSSNTAELAAGLGLVGLALGLFVYGVGATRKRQQGTPLLAPVSSAGPLRASERSRAGAPG